MDSNRRRILSSLPLGAAAGVALLQVGPSLAHSQPLPSHPEWSNASVFLRTRFLEVVIERYGTAQPFPIFAGAPGEAHVGGERGQAYRLKLRNLTASRLLVVASIDGLNVLSGKEAHPLQGGYILNAYGETSIDGWRKSLTEVAKFVFSAPSKSYAARVGQAGNLGVIGLAVFEEKRAPFVGGGGTLRGIGSNDAAEGLQLKSAAPRAAATPSLGTGHGDRDYSRVSQGSFERATVTPADVVRLDYDSLANLEARGVALRRPSAPARNPFPALEFIPDPPKR